MELLYDPAVLPQGITKGSKNTMSMTYLYSHCGIVHNTGTCTHARMHTGLLLGLKKEGNLAICNNLDELKGGYAK